MRTRKKKNRRSDAGDVRDGACDDIRALSRHLLSGERSEMRNTHAVSRIKEAGLHAVPHRLHPDEDSGWSAWGEKKYLPKRWWQKGPAAPPENRCRMDGAVSFIEDQRSGGTFIAFRA